VTFPEHNPNKLWAPLRHGLSTEVGVVLAMLALMEQASLFKWLGDVFSICSPFSDQFFRWIIHWLHWLIQERTHRILRISSPELRIEFTT
jgi:hypothetical protein